MEQINATPITLFDLLTILFTLIEQISFKFQAASRTMELKLIGDKLTQMAEKKIEKDLLLLLPIHKKCRSISLNMIKFELKLRHFLWIEGSMYF